MTDSVDRCMWFATDLALLTAAKVEAEAGGKLTTIIPAHGLPPQEFVPGTVWVIYLTALPGQLPPPPAGVILAEGTVAPSAVRLVTADAEVVAGELLGVPPSAGN